MSDRPEIGQRVILSGNMGKKLMGRPALVVAHHRDGTAFFVRVEVTGANLLCDPKNVEIAERAS